MKDAATSQPQTDLVWKRDAFAFLRHRWFHVWVLTVALTVALVVAWEIRENSTVIPAILLFGSLSGVLAFGIFVSDRLVLSGEVPFETIAVVVLYGGGIGVLFGGLFDTLFINDPTSWEILLVGPIEELAKLVVPVGIWLAGRHRSPRAGLVLGLASAAGFAVLETMGYGFHSLTEANGDIGHAALTPLKRGMMAPFGHMVWTGVACIVLWQEWRRAGHFAITKNVAIVLVVVMGLHSLNDLVSLEAPNTPILVLANPIVPVISYLYFKRHARELTPTSVIPSVPPGWRPRVTDKTMTAGDGSASPTDVR